MIKFNEPIFADNTLDYIKEAFMERHVSGDGKFTKLVDSWIEENFNVKKSLFVHSATAALELSALLMDLKNEDEVIMPSFTFVSTANAYVLRGAKPVFVDIRYDTLNIDENLIEKAITKKTKAIVPVHYAGVGCEMDKIMEIAKKYNLMVIEDAAQGFNSKYKGKSLGTIGDMGALSFHETKNIMSGEGGAFLTNNEELIERAEIIREKGTNRKKFLRGQVDKYTWIDVGSSYLPSDINAAYLYSLLQIQDKIQKRRIEIWNKYYSAFFDLEQKGIIKRPYIPKECTNNAHIFYLLLNSLNERDAFISHLKKNDIQASFHYIPLHSTPLGREIGKTPDKMDITDRVSNTICRLPLHYNLKDEDLDKIINISIDFLRR